MKFQNGDKEGSIVQIKEVSDNGVYYNSEQLKSGMFVANFPYIELADEPKKPLFTTHDGVDLFNESDEVWLCWTTGYDYRDVKDTPYKSVYKNLDIDNTVCYFSTKSACQKYIDEVTSEITVKLTKDKLDKLLKMLEV